MEMFTLNHHDPKSSKIDPRAFLSECMGKLSQVWCTGIFEGNSMEMFTLNHHNPKSSKIIPRAFLASICLRAEVLVLEDILKA